MTDSIMLFFFLYGNAKYISKIFLGIFTKNRSFNIINRFLFYYIKKCMNYIFCFDK